MNKKITLFRGLSRKELGRNAVLGIGFGVVAQTNASGSIFLELLGTILCLFGLVYGVAWIAAVLKGRKDKTVAAK